MKRIRVLIGDHTEWARSLMGSYIDAQPDMDLIDVVGDGSAIIEAVTRAKPDVLIMDLILPYVDGLGVLERIRNLTPRLRTLILSSVTNEIMVQKALAMGADYYLVKPVAMDLLTARIRQVTADSNPPATGETGPITDVESAITDLIRSVGIPAHLKGYRYLREAVALILNQSGSVAVTKDIYPVIARSYGTTPSRVERAIRHAIEVAWSRGDLELLHVMFGNSIHRARGRATNSEFMFMIADKLQRRVRAS